MSPRSCLYGWCAGGVNCRCACRKRGPDYRCTFYHFLGAQIHLRRSLLVRPSVSSFPPEYSFLRSVRYILPPQRGKTYIEVLHIIGVGACFGRILGIGIEYLQFKHPNASIFRACNGDKDCVVPGLYAMVGAAATLSGVTVSSPSLRKTGVTQHGRRERRSL